MERMAEYGKYGTYGKYVVVVRPRVAAFAASVGRPLIPHILWDLVPEGRRW
jgi:hypothetical protein